MANFVDCNLKDIDFLTLLNSLFANTTGTEHFPFRVVTKTKKAGDVIACKSKEEFFHLFRMACEIAPDGLPAVRICVVTHDDGAGLTEAPPCESALQLMDMARLTFCYDTNDDVCVYLADVS